MQALFRCFRLRSGSSAKDGPGYVEKKLLSSETLFNVNEIEALYVLFKQLSQSLIDDGFIHKGEFRLALLSNSSQQSFFADRVFYMFDFKQNGVIDFGEFVRALSIFHPDTPESDKIKFAYRLYDLRKTGFIEREEVKEMVMALLRESELELTDDEVELIVDQTMTDADSKQDGKIDLEEWCAFVEKHPSLLKNMTLPYLKELTLAFPSFVLDTVVPD